MQAEEELRHAIHTVEELQSIARTMKALAAASIRQYEQALQSLQEYRRSVDLGLSVALQNLPPETPPSARAPQQFAAVIFGSDRGMCGRFNEEIADFAVEHMRQQQPEQDKRLLLAVGARLEAHLYQPVQECFFVPGSVAAITASVQDIVLKLEEWRQQGQLDQAWLYYQQHSRQGRHPKALRLLPFDFQRYSRHQQPWPSRSLPTYSMQRRQLLAALIRQHVFITLFHASAESLAAEHASRLQAMQTAEKNIQEQLQNLELQFHQLRQQTITEELLDVVAGFEVLADEGEQTLG